MIHVNHDFVRWFKDYDYVKIIFDYNRNDYDCFITMLFLDLHIFLCCWHCELITFPIDSNGDPPGL